MGLENFPRDAWYVLGWSNEVVADGLLDRTVLGEQVIAFRTTNGKVAALRNRCPHRSAPLSHGRREGDAIRCGYHGMVFGADGRCLAIPGQDHVPANADVRVFPTAERFDWVWIWTGDPALADEAAIPALPALDEARWQSQTGHIHYQADAQLLHDNLLDFSHLAFVHEETLGSGASWADTPEVTRREDGLHIERWMPDSAVAPFMRGILPVDARFDLLNLYDFVVPGVLFIDTLFQPAGAAPRDVLQRSNEGRFVSRQAVTPEGDASAHYFFSAMVPAEAPSSLTDVFMAGTAAAFEEDRRMIEAQQELLLARPDEPISRVALAADAPLVQMRGLLRKLARAERDRGTDVVRAAAA